MKATATEVSSTINAPQSPSRTDNVPHRPRDPRSLEDTIQASLFNDVRIPTTTHAPRAVEHKRKAPPSPGEPAVLLFWCPYEETLSLAPKVRPSSARSTTTMSSGPNS